MLMRALVSVTAILAASSSLPALAQDDPHCAAPKAGLERIICNDAEAAEDDRAMHIAYQALLRNAEADGVNTAWVAAAKADQQAFLDQRAARFSNPAVSEATRMVILRESTALRAEQLAWYTPVFKARFPGVWANTHGIVEFTSGNGDNVEVNLSVADQVNEAYEAWGCNLSGPITLHSSTRATLETATGPVNFSIADGLLTISPYSCRESGVALGGSIAGHYFRMGADD